MLKKSLLMPKKEVLLSYQLSFLLCIGSVLVSIYADTLFLSHYAENWLNRYFLYSALFAIAFNLILMPLISRLSRRGNLLFNLSLLLLGLLLFAALRLDYSYLPLLFSIYLTSMITIVNINVSNCIVASFDIHSYKEKSFQLALVGSLSSIFAAIIAPVFIKQGGIESLFHLGMAILFWALIAAQRLTPLSAKQSTLPQAGFDGLFQRQSIKLLLLVNGLGILVVTLMQNAYSHCLMGHFDQNGMAIFLSEFRVINSVASVIIQLFFAKKLMTKIGLQGILLLQPISNIVFALPAMLFPSFAPIVLSRLVFATIQFGLYAPTQDLLINPYPSEARKKLDFYIKGYWRPMGSLAAVPLIYLVNSVLPEPLALPLSYLAIIIFSLLLLYYSHLAYKDYQITLQNALKEKRYYPGLIFDSPETRSYIQVEILRALKSQDSEVIDTALAFFEEPELARALASKPIKQQIAALLSAVSAKIRLKASLAVKNLADSQAGPLILAQLQQELEEPVGWALLDTLVAVKLHIDPQQLDPARVQQSAFIAAYRLWLLQQSEPSQYRSEVLAAMQGGVRARFILAKLAGYGETAELSSQNLLGLIQDPSPEVARQALIAAQRYPSPAYIPGILSRLAQDELRQAAIRCLASMESLALGSVLDISPESPRPLRFAAAKILCQYQSQKALQQLILLSQSPSLSLRLYIGQCLQQGPHTAWQTAEAKASIYAFISWLSEEITELLRLKQSNKAIAAEIKIQLQINRRSLLYWLGLILDAKVLLSTEKYLRDAETVDPGQLGRSYVLLDSIAEAPSLREAIQRIGAIYHQDLAWQDKKIHPENWRFLEHEGQPNRSQAMDLLDKTALLRQVDLFADLPIDCLQFIAEICGERDMTAGEYLFREGAESDHFYCIVTGQVQIERAGKLMAILGPAMAFGELGLLDHSTRTADARCTEEGILLWIEREAFELLLRDLPEILLSITKQTIRYLRENLAAQQQKRT